MNSDHDAKWTAALAAYETALRRYTAISDLSWHRMVAGTGPTAGDLLAEDNARTELRFLRAIAWHGFRSRM